MADYPDSPGAVLPQGCDETTDCYSCSGLEDAPCRVCTASCSPTPSESRGAPCLLLEDCVETNSSQRTRTEKVRRWNIADVSGLLPGILRLQSLIQTLLVNPLCQLVADSTSAYRTCVHNSLTLSAQPSLVSSASPGDSPSHKFICSCQAVALVPCLLQPRPRICTRCWISKR